MTLLGLRPASSLMRWEALSATLVKYRSPHSGSACAYAQMLADRAAEAPIQHRSPRSRKYHRRSSDYRLPVPEYI